MSGVGDFAVSREQIRHPAHFATAHRVRLSGETERAGAALADLAGGQMQVDQRGILRRARRRLVESLAVERERRRTLARAGREPFRRLRQVDDADPAALGNRCRRVVAQRVFQLGEAFGMGSDVGVVDEAFPKHEVQHPVEQRHVGAGENLQEQVGRFSRRRAPRIDDDQLHVRPCCARRLDPPE